MRMRHIPTTDAKAMGARIRQARRNAGLTQVQASRRAGMSQSHLSRCECGAKTPSLATAKALARALNTTTAAILEGAGRAETPSMPAS